MKLYFIRHGQTDWNLRNKIQGSYDSELNMTGIAQAEELSKKISELNYQFCKIYSSKQKRAVKTTQIISEITKVDYIEIDGLEEVKLGEWEGLTWDEVREKFPYEYNEWYKNRRCTKPPKGESYQDMLARVLKVIYRIINEEHGSDAHKGYWCDENTFIVHKKMLECRAEYKYSFTFEKNDLVLEMRADYRGDVCTYHGKAENYS